MREITVSLDEATHRRARVLAAELDTSVSALVRDCLNRLAEQPGAGEELPAFDAESPLERRRRRMAEVYADFKARGIGLQMSENRPREALYDRDAARAEALSKPAPPPQLERPD